MLTFAQLTTPVTQDQALSTLVDWLAAAGFNSRSWQSGSTQLTFLTAFARGYSKVTEMVSTLAKAGFNETAEGEWATRFARSNYDNERVPASTTRHLMQFACSSNAGPYPQAAGKIVVSDGTRTYRLVNDDTYPIVTIPSGGSVSMVCEAEVAGAAGNVAPGTITRMITTFVGVDCTNTSILKAGTDEEQTTRLRERNRTKWANLSIEVTADGCRYLALSASAEVQKTYIEDTNPRGAGTVDVYVFGYDRPVSPDGVTLVQLALDKRFVGNIQPNGSRRALAISAPEYDLITGGTIYCQPGQTAAAQVAVEAALLELVRQAPLSGFDYTPGATNVLARNDIIQAIEGAAGVRLSVLTTPAADLTIPDHAGIVPPEDWGFAYVETSAS